MWVVSGWVVSRNYNVITIRAYNFVEFCGLGWVCQSVGLGQRKWNHDQVWSIPD